MPETNRPDHLSRISTIWSLVFEAHGDDAEAVRAAQSRIMERYSATVYRYLLRVLGDVDAADEVFQEFALRFVRGGFRQADPERGRFRDYVKIAVLRLVTDYRRRKRSSNVPIDAQQLEALAVEDQSEATLDRTFLESHRDELLSRAWAALKSHETETGQPFFSVLDYRARHSGATSDEMAAELSSQLTRELTPANLRKILQRAREKFAAILLKEVSESLNQGSLDELEQELIDLGLQPYCRTALKRRGE